MPKSAKLGKDQSLESSPSGKLLIRKLVPILAKMSQDRRNLILFMAGRVAKKHGGMKRGRKATEISRCLGVGILFAPDS